MLFFGKSKKELILEKERILANVYNGFDNGLLSYCNNEIESLFLEDIFFDKGINSKSILTKELVSKLHLNDLYLSVLKEIDSVTSYYDSNGYFRLCLLGNNIEIIFSGCNCGCKGEGSLASYEILKFLYDLKGLDSSNLLLTIESNHFLNLDLKN